MAKAVARPGLAKKPRLTNVLGSAVKLQSNFGLADKRSGDKKPTNPVKSKFLSGHDSDKENWSPDEDESLHFSFSEAPSNGPFGGRRPQPTVGAREIGNNPRRTPARAPEGDAALFFGRSNTAPATTWARHGGKSDQSLLKVFEDHKTSPVPAKPDDEEVERFMRGQVSPSKKVAVDAIAGLLSLSQGNWR
jgi:hypothetical protein